jgi:hypothetical protein
MTTTYLEKDDGTRRSLAYWHKWLTTDQETGEETGNLRVPCSRYGRNGYECAFWSIAAELVCVEANGPSDSTEESLDHLMSLAVNDHDDIAELVYEYWYVIPRSLRTRLGGKREARRLTPSVGRAVDIGDLTSISLHMARGEW